MMRLKGVLAGSASVLAILAASIPALAQSDANGGAMETVVVTGIRASLDRAIDIKRNVDRDRRRRVGGRHRQVP